VASLLRGETAAVLFSRFASGEQTSAPAGLMTAGHALYGLVLGWVLLRMQG